MTKFIVIFSSKSWNIQLIIPKPQNTKIRQKMIVQEWN